jgi:hypothetical protein
MASEFLLCNDDKYVTVSCNLIREIYMVTSQRRMSEEQIILQPTQCNALKSYYGTIRHPDIRVKHDSIRAFTPIAVTLHADIFVYKTENCSKTVFRRKVL